MITRALIYKLSTVVTLIIVLLVLYCTHLIRADYIDITFLDVGQGDSALIDIHSTYHDPTRIMIDTGRDRQVISSLDSYYARDIRNYLSHMIVGNDIDTLILTHNDSDHVGMRCEIINRYNVKQVIISSSMSTTTLLACDKDKVIENKLIINYAYAGDEINIANANLKILSPPNDDNFNKSKDDNSKSIVVLLQAYNKKILYTGDIDKIDEMRIISNDYNKDKELKGIDVLKVAHHGSDGSSATNFIKYIQPKVSIISVGQNSYGHPSTRVLDDLTSASSTIYRTDEIGNVMFHLK